MDIQGAIPWETLENDLIGALKGERKAGGGGRSSRHTVRWYNNRQITTVSAISIITIITPRHQ